MKENLFKEYKFKTELHAHTLPVSLCSEFYADGLIEKYKSIGVDTVVLTNHFTPVHIAGISKEEALLRYTDCFSELKKCAEENGMNAIFGIELRFTENINDYLVYGTNENEMSEIYDYIDKGIDCFYREFKKDTNLIFQAHPFRDGMTRINPESIDGVEVFNMHPNHNSRVAKAASYAKEHGLLVSGGTDFHHPGHEGCCLIRTKTRLETPYDAVNALKNKDFIFDIFDNIVLP